MRGVPNTDGWVWGEDEAKRLRAAFARRFGEYPPRTETLFAVAAEGIRIYVERMASRPQEPTAAAEAHKDTLNTEQAPICHVCNGSGRVLGGRAKCGNCYGTGVLHRVKL